MLMSGLENNTLPGQPLLGAARPRVSGSPGRPCPGSAAPRAGRGYWKIIATETTNGITIAGFVFDQETARGAGFCEEQFVTSVRMIESRTGLDFFHALTREEQNSI